MNKGKKRTGKIANVKEHEGDKIGERRNTNTNQKRTNTNDDVVSGTSDQIAWVCLSPNYLPGKVADNLNTTCSSTKDAVNLLITESYGIDPREVFL